MYSLDLLQDIPEYIVNDIIQQLQSESTSTLTPSPHHHTTISHPQSCHIPSSIIYDLSTGQLHQTTSNPSQASPTPDPPQPSHKTKTPLPAIRVIRKRSITLPSQRTSFSRALSQNPTSVLRQTEHVTSNKHQHHHHHSATIHTLNHTLLLPSTPHPVTSHNQHTVRYPLGNPTVPRTLHKPTIDPLLAPYHTTSDNDGFLHNNMCLSHVHNTRLVTLHCMNNTTTKSVMTGADHTSISEDTTPSPADMKNDNMKYLPPILPSSLPSPSLPTCVSPDHMHMGAEIIGDQLVLDRAGEHVVHALRDTNMGRASRPETTPSTVGVVNGTKAPPPTAN